MSEVEGPETEHLSARGRRLVYLVVAAVLVAVAVAGMIVFEQIRDDDAATAKAERLHARLLAAGLAAPDPRVIADSLGADGGLVCQDPSSPLVKARYQAAVSNGATGPGARPVIADRDLLAATALAIETYCPDRLAVYLEETGTLRTGDTLKSQGNQ
ncbi:hypothetical protein IU501_13975 [Nocardia otitidiscaviarum]|uniref:hypothetical protein n=1 Tax=Nocardia otitidiscaviarum TaxID=1823 RepID=UPI0004A76ACD|nr:hypothetical protein [Nocardia otitidiscaviarum]MBF6134099.1 hypothetical protein [Nocardia otitidiscaviarum]MBF6484239.1 hypothetical protein [Nocardia otitidiscaviarum]